MNRIGAIINNRFVGCCCSTLVIIACAAHNITASQLYFISFSEQVLFPRSKSLCFIIICFHVSFVGGSVVICLSFLRISAPTCFLSNYLLENIPKWLEIIGKTAAYVGRFKAKRPIYKRNVFSRISEIIHQPISFIPLCGLLLKFGFRLIWRNALNRILLHIAAIIRTTVYFFNLNSPSIPIASLNSEPFGKCPKIHSHTKFNSYIRSVHLH